MAGTLLRLEVEPDSIGDQETAWVGVESKVGEGGEGWRGVGQGCSGQEIPRTDLPNPGGSPLQREKLPLVDGKVVVNVVDP